MCLAQNVCLGISRSSLKLLYFRSKTRSPAQIKGKSSNHSRGHMFEEIIMNLAQNVCLDVFRSTLKLGHLGSETRSQGHIKGKLC